MFCRTLAFSTLAQFGDRGTNQLYFAAAANGASCGLPAFTLASVVVLAMTLPCCASWRSVALLVKMRIQSSASEAFLLVAGTARSEPPRKGGTNLPAVWLGSGKAPSLVASFGLPPFAAVMTPHSQPLANTAPT